ncbi:MAG: HDOD domain-containing protein [Pseudomonadota bacterium]
MQTTEAARHKVQQLKQLPALSTTVSQLLAMLPDDNLEIKDLAKVIEQDPALTARIIGLANAAYFAQTRPINSVSEAIIRVLGLQMVKTLAFSIVLCGSFDASKCPGFRLDEYWFRAFGSAQLVRKLILKMDARHRPDPDETYLTALLLNIGVLVLVHLFPQDYACVLVSLEKAPGQDIEHLEHECVGLSSGEAGEWLTDRWHLPEYVVRAIASQNVPLDAGKQTVELKLINVILEWMIETEESSLIGMFENSLLGQELGLPAEVLSGIELDFVQQRDEIRSVARLLSV